jgi:hypothetical protein
VFEGSPQELRAAWEGRIWDLPVEGEESDAALQARLAKEGTQVLFRVAREGLQGLRVVSAAAPASGAVPVTPSLEDALLAILGPDKLGRRGGGSSSGAPVAG